MLARLAVSRSGRRGISLSETVDREQILSRLRERIVAYAASRLQRDVAEDLAQEVLMVLEEKYRAVEALDELVPLGFRILRFKMLSTPLSTSL